MALATLMVVAPGTLGPAVPHASATTVAKSSTVRADGLVLSLTVKPQPANVGAVVKFDLYLSATHAKGALGYVLQFGDGATSQNPVPMFCLAGLGRAAHETWQLSHRYARSGTFKIVASGYVNCGPGRISTSTRLLVR